MLRDPVEIEIASRARQPGIRNPNRPRTHFDHIFADFLRDEHLVGKRLFDLGPGQWDFAELARERGAASVAGIDNDPAVVELGEYKAFDAVLGDIAELDPAALGTFDGVFCKFSVSAFWPGAESLAVRIARLIADGGWGWIAPWNGTPAEPADEPLRLQAQAFRDCGFDVYELSEEQTRRYGLTGNVVNHPLFVLNL